ncbi:phytoene desaturase family protein [Brucella tritici]|uniref:phytoene desaturase family protein n=1 Tax=Brucella tritici TaxID=94626 RepID=UPI00158FF890|nr:NAD(P)/FAD-dependent oxidoreductase [Brucella tritici]
MNTYDHIIVGSGINALVAAAMLGKKGRKVLVLERADRIGGCIRTDEITAPGFIHDVMATTFVLFLTSPAYGAIGKDLEARGLEFAHADLPTGVLRPDGSHVVFAKDRQRNAAAFDKLALGDGAAFSQEMDRLGADAPFLFSLLSGTLWSAGMLKVLAREAWRRGLRNLAGWFGEALTPARAYLETTYQSETTRALWAPWVLHVGLNPESPYSAQMLKVIAFAIEMAGCPIVKGGASNLLAAFSQLIVDTGGEIRTNADVAAIVNDTRGRAAGVRLASGETINASKGVICSVTPNQLYGRLLADWPTALPPEVSDGVRRYRYGKGDMQIHYALSQPPRWKAGDKLGNVALLHLTPGLDGVSRAANEAERGMLPAEPTICVGQPTALDPSRAPEGGSILWLQLPETPRSLKGDAAGEIEVPADGCWTEEIRERYADRVEAKLAQQIEGFKDSVIARRCYSPADLEAMNVNLVGGDPYGGYCGLDQFFLWRPFKTSINHQTHVPGLYHIGASTHPGPGLSGSSGFLLASSLS